MNGNPLIDGQCGRSDTRYKSVLVSDIALSVDKKSNWVHYIVDDSFPSLSLSFTTPVDDRGVLYGMSVMLTLNRPTLSLNSQDGVSFVIPEGFSLENIPRGVSIEFIFGKDNKWILAPWGVEDNRTVLVAGYFSSGFTFTSDKQIGITPDRQWWSYNGSLPFTVHAGTVPNEPNYTNRGDAALRSALAAPGSTVLVGGQKAKDVAQWSKQVYLPDFFGAIAGEPDSTAKLQVAIDALPAGGVLNGGNREYNVRSLLLKSDIELANIRLKTIAGSVDFVSPISIIGENTPLLVDGQTYVGTGPKTNIKLYRVSINGNRQNQSAIDSPTEDGGRHGIRVLGRVTNLSIDECSAEFCATDGIEIFSNNSLPATENIDDLCFANITIRNSRFNSNRRHGIVGDSIFNIKMTDVDCKRNGLDLDTSFPLNHGNRGARFAGNLYGRPFDFEGYGIGSRIVQVEIIGGDFTGNVAGALFYDFADVTDPRFQPREDITIADATFDAVFVHPSEGVDASLTFFSTTATASLQGYDNVNISNCTFKTHLNIEGVKNLNVVGGSAKARFSGNNFFARVVKSKRWFFRGVNTDKPDIVLDALPFTPVWTNILGSPVFSSQEFTLAGFTSNGWLCKYRATYTAPVTGDYFGTISAAGCKLIPQSSSGLVNATAAVFNTALSTNGNEMRVASSVNSTAEQAVEVYFEVIPIV